MSPSDAELLQRYVDARAEDALAELVRRHVDLVYSAALRQTGGDAHFAQDVVQLVFVDFVRKAGQLRGHVTLTGWLYTSTRFAASKVVRGEQRRKARETEAYLMSDTNSGSAPPVDLRPVLDDAMHDLSDRDRETILWRFFERLPLAEIGRRLGVSQNAATKTVERALDRLRASFARRGITSSGAALAVALADQAVTAAPAGLANSITASLAAGTAAAGAGSAIFMSKTITASVVTCILVIGGAGFVQLAHSHTLRAELDSLLQENAGQTARARTVAVEIAAAKSELQTRQRENIELARTISSNPPANAPTPPPRQALQVVEALKNTGRVTPAATLETVLWAMATHDAQIVAACTTYDSSNLQILQALFDSLSPRAKAFFKSPEAMLAAALADGTKPVSRLEIVDVVPSSDDQATVHYRRNDDPTVRSERFRLGTDGWKMVGKGKFLNDPEKQDEVKYLAEAAAAKASP